MTSSSQQMWWCNLTEECPITLEPLSTLKYPPYALVDTIDGKRHETYFDGFCDPILEKYAIKNQYDLYILTDIDIPWIKDDLRDKPNNRKEMFDAFKNALIKYNRPFIQVSGDLKTRMKIATNEVDKLLIKN